MNKIKYCLFFLLVSMQVNSQTTGTSGIMTLKQCVETGIANNQQVLQAGLQSQTAEINLKQAKADRFPDLNASIGHGINQGRSIDPFTNSFINQQVNYAGYSISSGVTIFNGFVIQNSIRQNQLIYQATKMELQQAKDNLSINIILAYLQVLNNEDLLSLAYKRADLSKKQADRLEILNNDGAIAPSLLSDLKGQYASDQLDIINTKNALASAKLALCQLMNVAYDKNLQLEKINVSSFVLKYDNSPDIVYQTAMEQFSLIKAADLRKQGAEKAVKVAKGQLYPTLSFNGNANTNYSNAARQDIFINSTNFISSDYVTVNNIQYPVTKSANNYSSQKIQYGKQLNNNLFTSFSLNLRIPIFNSFQARNRIKLQEINLKNTELQEKTVKTQLQQAIDQAFINMTSASERYKTLQEQVSAFAESFRAADIRFIAGLGNSIDYLTAKNNLERANTNLVNAQYDFILRTKIIDYYYGKAL